MSTAVTWFIRIWAVAVALTYGAFVITTGSLWTSSDEWLVPALFPFLGAAAIFACAILGIGVRATTRLPQAAWCVMLVGSLIVLSFEFLLVPLLITAAPAAFARPRNAA